MIIEVPIIQEKELQARFEKWLIYQKHDFKKSKSRHAETFEIINVSPQAAFWIGCNYLSLVNRLFDGPLTKTLSG